MCTLSVNLLETGMIATIAPFRLKEALRHMLSSCLVVPNKVLNVQGDLNATGFQRDLDLGCERVLRTELIWCCRALSVQP